MSNEPPIKVVLIREEEYRALLCRMVTAPKNPPPLTPKQKNKVAAAMAEANIVLMHRQTHAQGPAKDFLETTLRTD